MTNPVIRGLHRIGAALRGPPPAPTSTPAPETDLCRISLTIPEGRPRRIAVSVIWLELLALLVLASVG